MCRLGVLVVAVALTGTPAGTARAQTEAELRDRVRRLTNMHDAALAAANRVDSQRVAGLDTVREGVLSMLVAPHLITTVRAAASLALPSIMHTYGDFALVLSDTARGIETLGPVALAARRSHERRDHSGRWLGVWLVFTDSALSVPDAANRIFQTVQTIGHAGSHPSLYDWYGRTALSPFSAEELDRSLGQAYIDLVTAPSPAASSCFLGDFLQCRLALGLVAPEDPATQWYSAAERRAVVERLIDGGTVEKNGAAAQACTVTGTDDACLRIIRAAEPSRLAPPLAQHTRISLLRFALQSGGPKAFQRFAGTEGKVTDLLAAAAGVPADSLIAGWRAAVLGARPQTVTTTAPAGWVALFWAVLFGTLALGNPRWHRT